MEVPLKVQGVIPVRRIWPDGIFLVGPKFTKTYKFSNINYLVASREGKESMFLTDSELLNSLDSGAVTKITDNNRRMNKANFEQSILMPMQGDFRDEYRREYNQMLLDKATGANGITQEKYITISVVNLHEYPSLLYTLFGISGTLQRKEEKSEKRHIVR